VFIIKLHSKDFSNLEQIKYTLGVGIIRKNGINSVQYIAESFKDLQVIIEHFDKYPLITCKVSDYLVFKQCFEHIKKREHLTEEGLLKIVGLKSSINWGLSENLKKSFPKAVFINRPQYVFKGISDTFWLAGFTSGDGSFHLISSSLNIKSETNKFEERVRLRYSLNLDIR